MKRTKSAEDIRHTEHTSAGTVIYRINKFGDTEVLIMYRKDSETWHIPKGTTRKDESLVDTAIRETKEETGLHVRLKGFIGKLDSLYYRSNQLVKKHTYYYLAQEIGKFEHGMDHEHDQEEYVEIHEAMKRLDFDTLHEKEKQILKKALPKIQKAI